MPPTKNKRKNCRIFSVCRMIYILVMGFVLFCMLSTDNIFTSASPLPISNFFTATRDAKEELKSVSVGVGRKVKTTLLNFLGSRQSSENGGNFSSDDRTVNIPSQFPSEQFSGASSSSSSQAITHRSDSELSRVGLTRPDDSYHGGFQQSSSDSWSHSISSPVIFDEESDSAISVSKIERGGTKTGSTKTGQTSSKTVYRHSSSKTSSSGSGWMNGGSVSGDGIQQTSISQGNNNNKLNLSTKQKNFSETNQHVGQDGQNYNDSELVLETAQQNNNTPENTTKDEGDEFKIVDVGPSRTQEMSDTDIRFMNYAFSNTTHQITISNSEQPTDSLNNIDLENSYAHNEISSEVSGQLDLNQDVAQNQYSNDSHVFVNQSYNSIQTSPFFAEDPNQHVDKSEEGNATNVEDENIQHQLSQIHKLTRQPMSSQIVEAEIASRAKHVSESSESQFGSESSHLNKVSVHELGEQIKNQDQEQKTHNFVEQVSQISQRSEESLVDTTPNSEYSEFTKEKNLSVIVPQTFTAFSAYWTPMTSAMTTTTVLEVTSKPFEEVSLNEPKINKTLKVELGEQLSFKGAVVQKIVQPQSSEKPSGHQNESKLQYTSLKTKSSQRQVVSQQNLKLVASENASESERVTELQASRNKAEEFDANEIRHSLPDDNKDISKDEIGDQTRSSKRKTDEPVKTKSLSVKRKANNEKKSANVISAEFTTTTSQNSITLPIYLNDSSEVKVEDAKLTDDSPKNPIFITEIPTSKFSTAECLDSSQSLKLRELWFWILFCCFLCLVILFLLMFMSFFVSKLLKDKPRLVGSVQSKSKDEYLQTSVSQTRRVDSDKKNLTSVDNSKPNLNCQTPKETAAVSDAEKRIVIKSSESESQRTAEKKICDNNLWNIDKLLLYSSSEGPRSNSSSFNGHQSYRDSKDSRHSPHVPNWTNEKIKKLSQNQANCINAVQGHQGDVVTADQGHESTLPASKTPSPTTVNTPLEMLSNVSLAQITRKNKQSLAMSPPSPVENVSSFQKCASSSGELKTITTTTVTVEHQQSGEKNSSKLPMSQKSENNITSKLEFEENAKLKKTDKQKQEFFKIVPQEISASRSSESIQMSFRDIYNRMETRKEMEKNRQSPGSSSLPSCATIATGSSFILKNPNVCLTNVGNLFVNQKDQSSTNYNAKCTYATYTKDSGSEQASKEVEVETVLIVNKKDGWFRIDNGQLQGASVTKVHKIIQVDDAEHADDKLWNLSG